MTTQYIWNYLYVLSEWRHLHVPRHFTRLLDAVTREIENSFLRSVNNDAHRLSVYVFSSRFPRIKYRYAENYIMRGLINFTIRLELE
jgi:hypothetical protein